MATISVPVKSEPEVSVRVPQHGNLLHTLVIKLGDDHVEIDAPNSLVFDDLAAKFLGALRAYAHDRKEQRRCAPGEHHARL